MKKRIACIAMITFAMITVCNAQNFSGLQNRNLNKIEDLSSTLESLLSRLGGSIDGSIDSVVVVFDSEKELRCMIYYSGFVNGFFSVSAMGFSREQQPAVTNFKFSQATAGSPVECRLLLNGKQITNPEFETPYLRIDISPKENRSGKIKVYDLRKRWKTEVAAENVIIPVALQPVGVASSLGPAPPQNDIIPTKKIDFNSQATLHTPYRRINKTVKTIGNTFYDRVMLSPSDAADISGNWLNTDVNSTGFSKLQVINNNSVRIFKKCASGHCDNGGFPLFSKGPDIYASRVMWESKFLDLNLRLVNGELKVDYEEPGPFGVRRTRYFTFKKELQLFATKMYSINEYAVLNWTVLNPPTTTSTVAEGPADIQMNLWNKIAVDPGVDFLRPQDISNININVYGDKNSNSGIWYILPADYHVRWEEKPVPANGYDFHITYGKQPGETAETESDAPVRISGTLTPGISSRERELVKAVLRTIDPNFKDIEYLQLREAPVSTLASTLNAQYGIPLDRISVIASSDLTNDIKVAWRTNPDTKEFIQTALTSGEGISASMILKPKNTNIIDQQIPLTINLADPRSLGKMNLEPVTWRTRYWRNNTPYPLQFKYLHVMKKATQGNSIVIYSWSMNNIEVPSLAQVAFDHNRVPAWLDNDPTSVMWIEYGVMECSECDRTVLDAVTGGVFGGSTQLISFTIAPAVYDSLNADYFMVTMRSKQADPKNEIVKELESLRIIKDPAKKFTTGPLFLAPGVSADFEYQITVATKDGEFYRSAGWIKAAEKEVLLGNRTMREIFRGIIPGIN